MLSSKEKSWNNNTKEANDGILMLTILADSLQFIYLPTSVAICVRAVSWELEVIGLRPQILENDFEFGT